MKSFSAAVLGCAIFILCITSAKAVTITTTLPSYSGAIDAAIAAAWAAMEAKAEAELSKYDNQKKLAEGFANANSFATSAAGLHSYQDYSLFGLMTGAMFSLQAPAFTYNKEYVERMRYKIERDGDANLGIGAGIATVNAGVNAGFIFPGLYINLKYGQIAANLDSLNSELEGFTYKELLLGGGITQIVFWPRTAIPGVLRWRGLSIGTGFYYSKTESSITILKSLITEPFSGSYNLILDPSFKVQVKSETMTIPFDITTSFMLFYIVNLSLGTGVDFNLGHTEIDLKAAGSITTDYDGAPLISPGYVTIKGGTKEQEPRLVNPKITAGIGVNLSAVKIEIPIAVYYLDSGFSIGLSAGIVW
ncbi:MAG: hypothetical protein JXN64_02680 [Spirochaetes bacterium]|nr:hypothetical protein [Spirochaetota bacterium]